MMGFFSAVSLKHSGRVRVAAGAVAQRPTAIVALWINAGLAERAASSIEMPRSGEHDGSHDGVEDRVDSGGEKDNNGLENDCAAVLREEDITETFIRGWGRGGQKVNKTSNCVQLVHGPTGLIVKCQKTRSRARNRTLARQWLAAKLDDHHNYKHGTSKAAMRHQGIRKRKQRNRRRALQRRTGSDVAGTGGDPEAIRRATEAAARAAIAQMERGSTN